MASRASSSFLHGLQGLRAALSAPSRRPTASLCRGLQTETAAKLPPFGFAFDIDGVLLRGSDPIPRAREALLYLQSQRIPFILLTNGGGKSEATRARDVGEMLGMTLHESMLIQSHTPFSDFEHDKDKTVLVVGGFGDQCRLVAESYGFKNVVTPADIIVQHPSVWPFVQPSVDYYRSFARPLPRPISTDPDKSLKIDAIYVFNDPRDWGLDSTIILDLLLSRQGVLGTKSPKNGDSSLPNSGYLQDGQPPLHFSNPDLWWPAQFHLPRLGQGAFRESLDGLWEAVTGGGVELYKTIMGKPNPIAYKFAEKRLLKHRNYLGHEPGPLERVYMVGDNPESDIRGGNTFVSDRGIKWPTILVKTGIYAGGEPAWKPTTISKDVFEAVQWAVEQEGWKAGLTPTA